MTRPLLPPAFADLEPFAQRWCLATEAERYEARLAATMADMQALYDAGLPRLRDVMEYLDAFPLDELPSDAMHLLHLAFSVVMVSLPVEVWRQPEVIDGGTVFFERTIEPGP